jgi:acetyl-CoA acetyltransferase
MSSAYEYAEGGEVTDELVLGWAVDKYGAQAVYGRTLSFHEIRMMDLAENVYRAYREREASENWAEWAEKNHAKARLLAEAGRLVDGE